MLAPRNFKRCPWHARLTNIFTRLYGIIIFVELLDDFIANAVDEGHTLSSTLLPATVQCLIPPRLFLTPAINLILSLFVLFVLSKSTMHPLPSSLYLSSLKNKRIFITKFLTNKKQCKLTCSLSRF
uniref:Uncharacterized protein n=1 Tax=Meloidogyne incognita TaxID=6306 RepID=A0A914LJ88_MELIC